MKDLLSNQTVRSTRPWYVQPAYPFTLVQFASITVLILPPEADQCQSEISSLAVSETFTERMQRIGTGSLHANDSVSGASDYFSDTDKFIRSVDVLKRLVEFYLLDENKCFCLKKHQTTLRKGTKGKTVRRRTRK